MKHKKHVVSYILLAGLIFLLDQYFKKAATVLDKDYVVNKFISFTYVLNRGISWGILNSQSTLIFSILTAFIILITLILGYYLLQRFKGGYPVYGELLIFIGSLSNIFDRILKGAVVDFILIKIPLGATLWDFPAFNIADGAIVLGVGILLIQMVRE